MEPPNKKRKLAPKIGNTLSGLEASEARRQELRATDVHILSNVEQDRRPPGRGFQQKAVNIVPVAAASTSERRNFDSLARHLHAAASRIQEQVTAKQHSRVLGLHHQADVSVLLMRWEDDHSTSADIEALDLVLKDQYRYRTDIYCIPSGSNPILGVGARLFSFMQNTPQRSLYIICYAGHSHVGADDDSLYWVPRSEQCSSRVRWQAVRDMVKDADANVLFLIDSAVSSEDIGSGMGGTKEGIAAHISKPEDLTGPRLSLLPHLIQALQKRATGSSFNVEILAGDIRESQRHSHSEDRNGNSQDHTGYSKDGFATFTIHRHKDRDITLTSSAQQAPKHRKRKDPHDEDDDDETHRAGEHSASGSLLPRAEPRILVCTLFVDPPGQVPSSHSSWLQQLPDEDDKFTVEGIFPGPSTLLLLSMPMSVWETLRTHNICQEVAEIQSHNVLGQYEELMKSLVYDGRVSARKESREAVHSPLLAENNTDRSQIQERGASRTEPIAASANVAAASTGRGFRPINRLPPARELLSRHPAPDNTAMHEAAEQLKDLSDPLQDKEEPPPTSRLAYSMRRRTTLPDSSSDNRREGMYPVTMVPFSRRRANTGDLMGNSSSPNKAQNYTIIRGDLGCDMCSHEPFRDATLLRNHIAAAHTRPFPCAFAFAGCNSNFGSKNEWKRHMVSQHLCMTYFRCSECYQNGKANEFNRKDLFTQHLRRMHAPEDLKRPNWGGDAGRRRAWEERVKEMQESCQMSRREAPRWAECMKRDCKQTFEGDKAWDDWTEHVGKHMEKGEARNVEDIEFLVKYGQEEGIVERDGDGGWRMVPSNAAIGGGSGGKGDQVIRSTTAAGT